MNRFIASWSIMAFLAVAPAAMAEDAPSTTDKKNASEQCKEQRTAMGTAAFNQLYGANKNDKNAFGKCVSKFAKDEQAERKAAKSNASKDCKAEEAADPAAFQTKYGTGKNGKNAHGNCVSQKAEEKKAAADEADEQKDATTVKAAKSCRTEQKADAEAFKQKYGTNKKKSNAFGKCVSAQAKAQNDDAS